MKRIVALLAVLCLLLAGVSALAATPAEVLGEWFVNYDRYDKPIRDRDFRLILNRDATGSLISGDKEIGFTWKIDTEGDVSIRVEEYSLDGYLKLENGLLSGPVFDPEAESKSRVQFTFGRAPLEAVKLPGVVAANQEDDFYGAWRIDYTVVDGEIEQPDESDAALTFTVDFAQITVDAGEDNFRVVLTNYVDGKLTFKAKDAGFRVDGENMIVELTDDGMARVYVEGSDPVKAAYYLSRTDGTAPVVVPEADAAEENADVEELAPEDITGDGEGD